MTLRQAPVSPIDLWTAQTSHRRFRQQDRATNVLLEAVSKLSIIALCQTLKPGFNPSVLVALLAALGTTQGFLRGVPVRVTAATTENLGLESREPLI
jgi:hypothetical protein